MADALAVGELPAWLGWTPPLVAGAGIAALTAALSAGAVAWGARAHDRLPPDAHWSERARLLWRARMAAGLAAVGGLVLGAVWTSLVLGGRGGVAVAVVAGVLVGARVGQRGLRRRLGWPEARGWEAVRHALAFRLAMYGHVWAVLIAVLVMPHGTTSAAVGAALVVLAVGLMGYAGLGLELGRLLRLVDPPPERLTRVVARVAEAAGIEPPRVLVVPSPLANAAAYPPGQRLFFTSRALDELDDAGLEAVAAHEVGHLTEAWPIRLARMTGLLPLLLLAVLPSALPRVLPGTGDGGDLDADVDALTVLVVVAAGVLALTVAIRRVAHRMEERADAHAKELPAYASALERIYAVNLLPAVMPRKGVHPHLYDRLVAVGAPPTWPRPAPPPGMLPAWFFGSILVSGLVCIGVLSTVLGSAAAPRPVAWLALVAGIGGPRAYGELGDAHEEAGDIPTAIACWRVAAAGEPWNPVWPAREAEARAYAGDCAGAVDTLRRASGAWAERVDFEPDAPGGYVGLPFESEAGAAAAEAVRTCFDGPE